MRRLLCRWLGHDIEILGDPDLFPCPVRCRRCGEPGTATYYPSAPWHGPHHAELGPSPLQERPPGSGQ